MVHWVVVVLIATSTVISSAQVSNDDLKRFADANNRVAASLYPRLINGNSDNVFFCPLSLMTGLGVMLYGARGDTQQELYSILGYKAAGLPINKIPTTYKYYFAELLPENIVNFANYSLFCADEVLISNKAPLYPKFRAEAQDFYTTSVQNVDFSNNKEVANNINSFVNKNTIGKINNLVNSVNPLSQSILVDAVFFKGKWETPFPPYLSLPQPFYSPKGEKDVPFMQLIHTFPYLQNNDYQAVLLPYVGGNLALLILLSRKQNGLSNLEQIMTPDKIVSVLNQLQTQKTLVLLPKFKFQYYRDFSKDFEALGARTVYDGPSDFSGMTSINGLTVTETLYKAALEVDDSDQGPGMRVNFRPPVPPTIIANHPFMFAVVDRRFSLLLFLGRVIDV